MEADGYLFQLLVGGCGKSTKPGCGKADDPAIVSSTKMVRFSLHALMAAGSTISPLSAVELMILLLQQTASEE
jgi:hypothetical protein